MSLFNRPAWATTDASDDDDPNENLFSHSNHSYTEIVADEQRRKRERAEKQRLKQERREHRSSAKRIKNEGERVGSGSPKRRRITLEEGEDLLGSVGLSPAMTKRRAHDGDSGEDDEQDVTRRRSPRSNKMASRDGLRPDLSSSTLPATVIELDESESEPSLPRNVPPVEPMEEESDDEFAELARQARARRLKAEDAKKSHTPDVRSPTPRQDAADFGRTVYPTPPPIPDPPVKLFISSELPDTQPLIVYRKLSQRLQEIRKVWCTKQGFSEEQASDVFLIHRMKKLYDVTTCKSLGLYANERGEVAMKGAEGMDGVEQVHLEAVTEALYAQLKVRKDYEERKRQGLLSSEEEAAQAGASETQPTKEDPLIRILLKTKGTQDPFKLKVKSSTLFSKIVSACRPHFNVEENQSLHLEFDGDRLDPEEEVKSTDLSDMDVIDVHIV
ncbi:hypothetical protein LTR08_007490 [Meristemomyces frigidus]|nr:hypothetical protein LTR08_007490 [Meristemomyces frigidus]